MTDLRVVSLVPSVTETLLGLGVTPVACTRFCGQPGIPTIGGTKDPDVDAIVALGPDIVIVNDEENRRADADVLAAAGVALHSMSPRSVGEVAPAIEALAARLGVEAPASMPDRPARGPVHGRALILIWRRPWMSQSADTYGASMLDHLGWTNLLDPSARYPELSTDELHGMQPDLVVLPDEPYPFGARHVPELAAIVPGARIVLVDGRDLLWWGIRTADALARLERALERNSLHRRFRPDEG
ncbi:MAG: ABC transporter substrate-binding protein [Acidimicrobiia bacterium]|nr:ABC transporter substrate-binding protein [Acidimicrobiia bacterium]